MGKVYQKILENKIILVLVPIHVLEELWDALKWQHVEDSDEIQSAVLTVQLPNSDTWSRRQTLKLLAHIGKQLVLVLVDSGVLGRSSVISWCRHYIFRLNPVLWPPSEQLMVGNFSLQKEYLHYSGGFNDSHSTLMLRFWISDAMIWFWGRIDWKL